MQKVIFLKLLIISKRSQRDIYKNRNFIFWVLVHIKKETVYIQLFLRSNYCLNWIIWWLTEKYFRGQIRQTWYWSHQADCWKGGREKWIQSFNIVTPAFDSQIRMSTIEEMKLSKVWLDHNVQREEVLFYFILFMSQESKHCFISLSDDIYFTMCENKELELSLLLCPTEFLPWNVKTN